MKSCGADLLKSTLGNLYTKQPALAAILIKLATGYDIT